jgi:glycosyltransferase involved in cell wall biosynthesis
MARENFIVGLGAIMAHKNIKFVIEALAKVREPRPRLVWIGNVGNQPYLKELIGRAAALQVDFEPRVRVSDAELVDALNRALTMVYAPRLEPFGFAPLEANACGAPVVAVAEGGVRETVTDGVNGLLVDGVPEAMAAGIEQFMREPAYARRLGEAGASLVARRWSMAAAIDRLEARFSEVLNPVSQAGPKQCVSL